MSEERKIILDLLAEGRITADEAEQLLDALDETDPYDLSDSGQADQVDQGDLGDLGDLGDQLGARADAIAGDLSDRLSKAVSEMAEAGQELPDRLARTLGSMFGSLGWPLGPAGVQAEQTFESEMPADCTVSAIDFATLNGSVKLTGWDRPGYKVVARARVKGAETASEAQRRLAAGLGLSLQGGVMRVECTDQALRNSLSIEACVPRASTYDIKVNTRNGSAKVESLTARSMEVHSANGRVVLEDVAARNATASARNGSVNASGDLGDANLETANGSVSVTLSYRSAGRLRVNTGNGSVRLCVPRNACVAYEINAHTVNGSVRSSLNGAEVKFGAGAGRSSGKSMSLATCPGSAVSSPPVVIVDARALNGSVSVQSV
ncbi:MAG TPA: hypothetical protein DCL63_11770 [Firmicutes bacterium]|jgi:hypothetical protein|nr:hypothetical protein [Bacillota bacterium]